MRSLFLAISLLSYCLVSTTFANPTPLAELVTFKTEDGVVLHGLLYKSRPETDSVVIHVSGGSGAFYGAQNMAPLATELMHNGVSLLSVNMRTAGANGMLFADFEDNVLDIDAAVEFSRSRGIQNVVLLGHSLGAARVVLYMSRTTGNDIKAVILSGAVTSPYHGLRSNWNEPEKEAFDVFLDEQRALIKSGDGRTLSSYALNPAVELEHSAATWVNVFGNPEESNASTVKPAKEITVPALLIHGAVDRIALPGNADEIRNAMVNSPAVELHVVRGANHVFTHHSEQYAAIVLRWLKKQIAIVAD